MLPLTYNLQTLQVDTLELNLQIAHLLASLMGINGYVTPQDIIDHFTEIDRSYGLLKSHVESIQQSLDVGHDADRGLFLSIPEWCPISSSDS